MILLETRYNPLLVVISIAVAIFASFVALDLVKSISQSKGRMRAVWISGGALAMGFGIWSMHFVGMLAFHIPGIPMAYDVSLMILSIIIAVAASSLALLILSQPTVSRTALLSGGIAMAAAIAGMHYTGMYSMRMPAKIVWNLYWVTLSVVIALFASFAALLIAIRLRRTNGNASRQKRIAAVVMGIAIAGMHYTGMLAATFVYAPNAKITGKNLLATSELGLAVIGTTTLILGLAFVGSVLERAFSRRSRKFEETSRRYQEATDAITLLQEERSLRDRFVSALVHDLRTPLTAARVSTQLSIRKADLPEEVEKLGGRVLENLRRIDQMAQDLLDAHRISAGQALPVRPERVLLKPILEKSFEDLATVHGARFTLECDEALAGTWDPTYLRRAVENLCANAVKYGKPDSPVSIRATRLPGGEIDISVMNQGNPISPNERENLFDLFHRGKGPETTQSRGWGLGLTIVKGIAEAHQGSVLVESDEIHGTTFTIHLPVTSVAAATAPSPSPASRPRPHPAKDMRT